MVQFGYLNIVLVYCIILLDCAMLLSVLYIKRINSNSKINIVSLLLHINVYIITTFNLKKIVLFLIKYYTLSINLFKK